MGPRPKHKNKHSSPDKIGRLQGLIKQFEEISFKHLPREENYLADALATLATMFKVNANAEAQLVKPEV